MDTDPTPSEKPAKPGLPERAKAKARSTAAEVNRRMRWQDLRWEKVGLYCVSIVAGALLLVIALGLSVNTGPGKRLLLGFVNKFTLESGLGVRIGAIDGSLYGNMTLRDVEVRDGRGTFARSPRIAIDWHPLAYINRHVDINDISSPLVEVLRRPELRPSTKPPEPDKPLLPDLDIDIDSLKVDRIRLYPGVAGPDARIASLSGAAHLTDGRAQLTATSQSDRNDRFEVILDSVPKANRLDLTAHLNAPEDGVIAGLAGLKSPLRANIAGKGEWKDWKGKLLASYGEAELANLDLTARGGRFGVAGVTRPDLFLSGESAAILQPNVRVDLDSTLRKRNLDMDLGLTSEVATVKAAGLLNLEASRFGRLEVQVRLLRPERLDRSFTGQDLRADLTLEGAFGTPRIDYDIDVTRFGLGKIYLTNLHAEGKSRIDRHGKVTVPLDVSLGSLTGIGAEVDPLLTNLRLDGDIDIEDGNAESDNLVLKSDRLSARGSLRADLAAGTFQSDLKAGLKNYRVANLGTINVDTGARVVRNASGLSVTGTFTGQSTRWENASVAKVLGGNARLNGGYGLAPNGQVALRNVTGNAPAFRLLALGGTFGPDGRLNFNARAQSTQYGPLDAVVTGTVNAPQAVVKAAKPGLGMQIENVIATLNATEQGYAIKANGDSAYGPFDADTLIIMKNGPLTVDVRNGHFAGVAMQGRIVQSQAGPFTGTLALDGSGLNGTAALYNAQGDQGAAIQAVGNNVALPGQTGIQIGRAIITANAVLRKEIAVDADVQLGEMTYGTAMLSTGRAKVLLRGQTGTIQAIAKGQKEVPLEIAINGEIRPNLYTIAAKGKANNIDFRLANPARIRRNGDGWSLDPTTLVTQDGRMDISGHFNGGYRLQARLNQLNLAAVNAFMPDAGLTGSATGAVDFVQTGNAYPTARANLRINNFSRASVYTVSTPVDLAVDASLNPSLTPADNFLRALVRRGGAVVGRIQMNLSPSQSGEGWVRQVTTAGISGGIRYNGPAEVLFSLTGQARQQLSGPVAVAADFSGQLNDPRLNGVIKANSLTYDNETFGTRITAMKLDGRFSNDRLELTTFSGRAGNGTVTGNGWVSLAANEKFPLQVHVELRNARLARSDNVDSTVSGTLDFTNTAADGPLIKGDLRLPEVRYVFIRQGAAEINELSGVRRKGYRPAPAPPPSNLDTLSLWKLDVRVRADNQVFISGMGLESEWRMNLHVVGTTRDPRVEGEVNNVRGIYSFAGRDFNIDQGTIRFDGGALTNPEIDLNATAVVEDVTGVIKVTGTATRPDVAFSSTPALPQDEILSRLLFGQSVTDLSATEALQLASAVNNLRGGGNGLNPLGAIRSATGVDRLRIIGADAATGRGTSLAAGKYLTNSVYVEVVTDTKGFAATQIEIALSRALSVLSQAGNTGTAVSVKYSKDY
ncbi:MULTISPECIES: translocation/assembly module TamB domain-containing protein [Asticcacaulis]|uniref:translocation/assembly module TamB domain-containing protein n=1 Tax=Asticcacaulis TaxID=76890 RepID=UPI001AE99460|nr:MULTISPECIES: translocation/assembly module TamB domain-containing protein [Asticcacaulis]MBP2161741.1 translocation and assembly module TamB [Asticcacaulis solisilvae]MDR6802746.1 translocation and assembly module TamB [Asticcacaulis sp. BE141]